MRSLLTQLVNREAQTSDTGVYRKNLPVNMGISAIDIGIRLQNGSTSAVNKDILDVIKKLELVFNGNERRWSLPGTVAFRHNWMKFGAALPYNFDQSGSATQEVWFRMMLGRYLGDELYGLDTRRFNNVQVQIDYDNTVWGAAAVTTFTTGTFAPSILLHQFAGEQIPAFRGMIGTREFYSGTSVASGDLDQDLPTSRPIAGIGIAAMEDNIAEGTDVTDIVIGNDNLARRWVDLKWYNAQAWCNQWIHERSEEYKLYATTADSLDCHLANIRRASCEGVCTALVSGSTDGVQNHVHATTWTGNRLTIGGETQTTSNGTLTTQTSANLSAKAAWMLVEGDIHGYLYFPFANWATMENVLMPSELQGGQVRLVQGGAGATLSLLAEEVYT